MLTSLILSVLLLTLTETGVARIFSSQGEPLSDVIVSQPPKRHSFVIFEDGSDEETKKIIMALAGRGNKLLIGKSKEAGLFPVPSKNDDSKSSEKSREIVPRNYQFEKKKKPIGKKCPSKSVSARKKLKKRKKTTTLKPFSEEKTSENEERTTAKTKRKGQGSDELEVEGDFTTQKPRTTPSKPGSKRPTNEDASAGQETTTRSTVKQRTTLKTEPVEDVTEATQKPKARTTAAPIEPIEEDDGEEGLSREKLLQRRKKSTRYDDYLPDMVEFEIIGDSRPDEGHVRRRRRRVKRKKRKMARPRPRRCKAPVSAGESSGNDHRDELFAFARKSSSKRALQEDVPVDVTQQPAGGCNNCNNQISTRRAQMASPDQEQGGCNCNSKTTSGDRPSGSSTRAPSGGQKTTGGCSNCNGNNNNNNNQQQGALPGNSIVINVGYNHGHHSSSSEDYRKATAGRTTTPGGRTQQQSGTTRSGGIILPTLKPTPSTTTFPASWELFKNYADYSSFSDYSDYSEKKPLSKYLRPPFLVDTLHDIKVKCS